VKGGQTQYKYGVPNNPLVECIFLGEYIYISVSLTDKRII